MLSKTLFPTTGEPITLCGDGTQTGEFTMIELAEAILDLTGSRSALVHRPLPTDDPRQRQPDITLAREHLGWEPRIPLREGLKPTIAYFEGLLNEGFGKGRAVA